MTQDPQRRRRGSVRLIFEYEGDDIRLVHQERVDMAVSGFDTPREYMPGKHVEVRRADELVISRVPVRADLSASVEVFPESPDEPISRVDLPEAKGVFTVVVPVTELADHVSLIQIPPPPAERAKAGAPPRAPEEPTELARFALEER